MKLKLKKENIDSKGIVETNGIKKKFFNKKVMAIISILLVGTVVFTGFKLKSSKPKATQETKVKYTTLSKTNISKGISSSGAVKSGTSTTVYSNFNDYNVQAVNVEVGDSVKAGDVLAVIDTSSLEDEIKKLELSVTANEKKTALALEEAKKEYENQVYLYNNNLNTTIVNAEAEVNSSKLELDNKQRIYEYNKQLLQNDAVSQQTVNEAENDYENAKTSYEKALVSLDAAKVTVEQNIAKAKSSYESAQAAANDTSDRLSLENKKDELKNKEVIAPVDGTITSVNATVGSVSESAMFVIQDLNDLIVNVDVDETEIADVAVGQKVQVTSDATGDVVMEGEVVKVDPISSTSSSSSSSTSSGGTSSTSSSNSTSSDVTFTAKVQIKQPDEHLKVGMNAVVNIITDEVSDVYAVPYEAIVENGPEKVVYAAVEKNGQYVVTSIPVTTGMESDVYVEIEGDDLSDGMIILNDPSSFEVGSIVDIKKN